MTKLLLCVVLAAACGGGNKPAAETPANKQTVSSSKLTITNLEFFQADKLGMKLAADGTISASLPDGAGGGEKWMNVAVLTADGKLSADGKIVAQLQDDGTVAITDSKDGFKLDGTALVSGDKRITIDAKGMFAGGNPEMPPLRVQGLTDDGSKRAALLLLGVMSVSGAKAKPEK